MRITICFVLIFCALQQVQGSKSTKKKGDNRLMTWIKKGLIVLAVNYGMNKVDNVATVNPGDKKFSLYKYLLEGGWKLHHESEIDFKGCKYIVPDRNAAVMMEYIVCSKQPDFEKYLADNSENCSNVKALYEKVKSVANCGLNITKNTVNGALTKLAGKQSNQDDNMKMLKEHLQTNPETKFLKTDYFTLGEGFDFFQFVHVLDLTKLSSAEYPKQMSERTGQKYPSYGSSAIQMALDNRYKDVDVDHAKRMLELTRLQYPDNDFISRSMTVSFALDNRYKDVDVDHAKRMLKLARLQWPENERMAVHMVLYDLNYHKDVNVDHVHRMLDLTKLLWPDNESRAVSMALENQYKDVDVHHAKRMLELTKIKYPNSISSAVHEALEPKYKAVDVDKVYEKYQDLKNSWSLFNYWYSYSDDAYMRTAFYLAHTKFVKEDF